jgi:hypothetical protein
MGTLKLFKTEPASADEEVAELRLRLNHLSLSELEEKGVVNYRENDRIVRKGKRFGETWDEINQVEHQP